MGRPSRRLLTREQIAVTALELLDEEGPAGLGMRPLAARLGVSAPSLYHHVEGVDEVVEMVHDLVDAEIDLDALDDPEWRRGVETFARSYRRAFLDHPHVLTLVARRLLLAANALRVYDRLAAALVRAGVPRRDAMRVMAELDYVVLGSTVDNFVAGFSPEDGAYAEDYPHLASVLAVVDRDTVNDAAFERALRLLLDDVAALVARRPSATGARPRTRAGGATTSPTRAARR